MDEYISREAVEQVLCGIANGLSVGVTNALETKDVKALYKIKGAKEILNTIDNDLSFIPTADVQPLKHGWWIDCTFYDPYEKSYEQNFEYKCSCCGHMIYNMPNDDNQHCGHCGARMDGEQNV